MKIGGDHMFSEASAERFVCRARTSPFCPSEYVKMVCRGHHEKPETVILTVSVRVFDVCARKLICHYYHACEGIVLG